MKAKSPGGSASNARIIVLSVLVVAGILCLVFGCSDISRKKYEASPDSAFLVAKNYVSKRLLVEQQMPSECQYEPPMWYRIGVDEVGKGQYSVRGAVAAGNFYCVIDVSYFSASVRFDENNQQWTLLGEVEFSNPCVTTERAYFADECIISEWTPGWQPTH